MCRLPQNDLALLREVRADARVDLCCLIERGRRPRTQERLALVVDRQSHEGDRGQHRGLRCAIAEGAVRLLGLGARAGQR